MLTTQSEIMDTLSVTPVGLSIAKQGVFKILKPRLEEPKHKTLKNKVNKKKPKLSKQRNEFQMKMKKCKNDEIRIVWQLDSNEEESLIDFNTVMDNVLELEDERAYQNSVQSESSFLPSHSSPVGDLPLTKIQEEPCQSYRFRYTSEQGVVACLYGENSTQKKKTYPTLTISNINSDLWSAADVYVSCVTHDSYMAHPNMIMNIKRKKGQNCSNGVYHVRLDLSSTEAKVQFEGIGIRRVTGDETIKSLEMRKKSGIDPFRLGYINKQGNYNKEAVKLCFQVNLYHVNGKMVSLEPITSKTISHTKSKDMRITSLAPKSATCNQKLIILCEHLPKPGDIGVEFTIGDWRKMALPDFEHHNCALQVSTPQLDFEINQETPAQVRLVRRSNNTSTDPVTFSFIPTKINQNDSLSQFSRDMQLNNFKHQAEDSLNDAALMVEKPRDENNEINPCGMEFVEISQEISTFHEIDHDLVSHEWSFHSNLRDEEDILMDLLNQ